MPGHLAKYGFCYRMLLKISTKFMSLWKRSWYYHSCCLLWQKEWTYQGFFFRYTETIDLTWMEKYMYMYRSFSLILYNSNRKVRRKLTLRRVKYEANFVSSGSKIVKRLDVESMTQWSSIGRYLLCLALLQPCKDLPKALLPLTRRWGLYEGTYPNLLRGDKVQSSSTLIVRFLPVSLNFIIRNDSQYFLKIRSIDLPLYT